MGSVNHFSHLFYMKEAFGKLSKEMISSQSLLVYFLISFLILSFSPCEMNCICGFEIASSGT